MPSSHDLHSFPTRRSSDLGDKGSEAFLSDMVGAQSHEGARAMAMESLYEYGRSEEHTSELQSRRDLVCRLLPEKKKTDAMTNPDQRDARLALWRRIFTDVM